MTDSTTVDEDVELGFPDVADGNVKRYNYVGKFWQFFIKLNIHLTHDSAISSLDIYPNEMTAYVHKKYCIECSYKFVNNFPKLKTV